MGLVESLHKMILTRVAILLAKGNEANQQMLSLHRSDCDHFPLVIASLVEYKEDC